MGIGRLWGIVKFLFLSPHVKVQHPDTGVHFYRVQGTDGWVFDRRPASEPGDDDTFMLLEESMVKKGLFVYECVPSRTISIRKEPNVGRGSNATDRDVNEGNLVAVDAIRQSPFNHGNGPFLRLTDGSGWLFEFKHGERLMDKVSVWEGKWQLKVLNSPSGIGLRRQPIDCQNFMDGGIAYEPGSIVTCSHMVQASSGVKFYRVQGTDGWIFDQRNGQSMLTLVSTSHPDLDFSPSKSNNGNKSCWSPDFVRGIAAAVEGVHEIAFNENSRVISFRTADHARINVYYTTRTIGTALSHPAQGATQLFRRNCSTEELLEILKNPRFHTAKGYKRKRGDNYSSQEQLLVRTEYGQSVIADQEDEARNVLLDVDEEMEKLLQKKNRLLTKIRDVDLERAAEASVISEKVAARRREQDERKEQAERRQQAKHQLQQRTCDICDRVFPNQYAKQQHYNAVHVFKCNICWKSFSDQHSLYQHQDALGHF